MNLAAARAKLHNDLRDALDEALGSNETPKPVVVVQAPGGVGKSRVTAQLLSQHRVTWFGERNAMMSDIAGFHGSPIAGLAPLPGPATTPPSFEKRMSRQDAGACSQYDKRVLPLEKAELGRHIQAFACRGCPDRKGCVYQNWKPKTDWLFAPHVWLGLDVDHKLLFEGRGIVVVDESPLPTMLARVTMQAWEVTQVMHALRQLPPDDAKQVGATALTEIFTEVEKLLTTPPARKRVALRELARDLGYQFISKVSRVSVVKPHLLAPLPPITSAPLAANPIIQKIRNLIAYLQKQAGGAAAAPGLKAVLPRDIAQVILKLKSLPADVRGKLAPLADALAADTNQRPACVLVLPSAGVIPGIAAGHFKPLPVPDDLPLVILDATADVPSRYWHTLSHREGKPARRVITVDVDVDLAATIYQTVNHRYPSATFKGPNSAAITRLMAIVDAYKNKNRGKVVGVIVKKSDFDNDVGFRNRVLQSVPRSNVGFFWALRGDNSLQNVDALFVIGAPELSSLEAEALARAYMSCIPPVPGEEPFDYVPTTTKVKTALFTTLVDRHGREIAVEERGYSELEQFLAWRLCHHDEYIQALLRARPYDPAKKKELFFLSNTLLTTVPVTYVTEEDFLGTDLWVKAKEVVDNNTAQRKPKLTQQALALLLNVNDSTISKARKKHSKSWSLIGF